MRFVCIATAALALAPCALFSGCTGKSADEAKKELEKLKKKEKPKPPFDQLKVFTQPNEKAFTEPKEQENQAVVRNAIKPGHWTGVLVEAKANHFDFGGDLISEPRNNQQNLVDLEDSPFALVLSRPAALAKGQRKTLEAIFYAAPWNRTMAAPEPLSAALNQSGPAVDRRMSTWMYNQLRARKSGVESRGDPELLHHMPSFQYYLFVLARDVNRYRYLKVIDSVRPPAEASSVSEDACFYRVLCPRISVGQPLALPSNALCWTSVAYVVWDDVLPSSLTPAQQQALLDWLHWGGGLIISGPQTLDALRGGFLEPYLPATAERTVQLDGPALAELNEHWTIAEGGGRRELEPAEPWSGIELAKRPDADFVAGTGKLVVERRVGRGRIVATAFRLSEHDLVNWRSFDSFFNGGILRHPRRQLDSVRNRLEFVGHGPAGRFDPELVSNVRFFTRDAKASQDASKASRELAKDPLAVAAGIYSETPGVYDAMAESDLIDALKAQPGVAAWNDFSRVSTAARQTLRSAAGIAVPKRQFVLWMVGIYLLLIVPVNWLFFRLLGRVEWAWLAVPAIALGWGAVVIWLAQLDIGFARAETEVAVLELQGDFSRAHLTRYTALYSSLSTSYNLHFDDPTAVAQPFAVDLKLLHGQGRSVVTLRHAGDNQLTDYIVSSNSTGMVHSEQMFDLGGSLAWHAPPDAAAGLENNSRMRISGAAVLRRRQRNSNGLPFVDESTWLGDLPPGARIDVVFRPHDAAAHARERDRSPLTTKDAPEGGFSLRQLIDFAEDFQSLAPGEVRLVGWRDEGHGADEELAGLRIEPAASQARRATLVVANLQFAPGGEPGPDMNLRVQSQGVGEQAAPAGGPSTKQ